MLTQLQHVTLQQTSAVKLSSSIQQSITTCVSHYGFAQSSSSCPPSNSSSESLRLSGVRPTSTSVWSTRGNLLQTGSFKKLELLRDDVLISCVLLSAKDCLNPRCKDRSGKSSRLRTNIWAQMTGQKTGVSLSLLSCCMALFSLISTLCVLFTLRLNSQKDMQETWCRQLRGRMWLG